MIVGREVVRAETKAQVMAMTATAEGEPVGANMAASLMYRDVKTAYGLEVLSRMRGKDKYLQHLRSSLLGGTFLRDPRSMTGCLKRSGHSPQVQAHPAPRDRIHLEVGEGRRRVGAPHTGATERW